MVRVRNRNLFQALPTFQLPRNIHCNTCFLLRVGSRTPHEHTCRIIQPLEWTSSDLFQKLGTTQIVGGCREPMLGPIASKVKMKSRGPCTNGRSYLLEQPRKPVHDVERQLPIVDTGTVHAELHATRSSHLRGKHRGFTENNYPALAKAEDNSLSPTRC